MLWFIIVGVLLLLTVGLLPTWPHMRDRSWGYAPSLVAFLLLLLLIALFWLGTIMVWWPGSRPAY